MSRVSKRKSAIVLLFHEDEREQRRRVYVNRNIINPRQRPVFDLPPMQRMQDNPIPFAKDILRFASTIPTFVGTAHAFDNFEQALRDAQAYPM